MSGSSKSVPTTKGTSTLVRPRFAPGMLLQHDDLEQISSYTQELSRLLFRSFFGCGVICGLVVKPDPKCGQDTIVVGAGLGLDCIGDPIHVPKDTRVTLDENCEPNPNNELWVVLCATSRCCAPRPSMCPGDEDEADSTSCTRERHGFEIRVVPQRPKCACSCVVEEEQLPTEPNAQAAVTVAVNTGHDCQCADPNDSCYKDHYLGVCGCGCDDCARGASCDCLILAKLTKQDDDGEISWDVDHSVRRFIRPVLVRDPQPDIDKKSKDAVAAAVGSVSRASSAPTVAQPGVKPAVSAPVMKRTRGTSKPPVR